MSASDGSAVVEEQLLEAARLTDMGEEDEALKHLLTVEPEHPTHPTLLCMIGVLAAHVGVEGMAVDYFRRCLAESPTEPQLLVAAGSGLVAAGDPAAEPALRLAALTAPDLPAARMAYGSLLVKTGLVEQGMDELLAARSLDPDDAAIRQELGMAYLVASRMDDALAELEAAVAASDEDDPSVKLLFGLALIQAGELSRAAEELHPIAERLAADGEAQIILALLFALEEWEDEAWLAVSRAESGEGLLDSNLLREVEDAIAAGEESVRSLLLDEIAPSALRERILRG